MKIKRFLKESDYAIHLKRNTSELTKFSNKEIEIFIKYLAKNGVTPCEFIEREKIFGRLADRILRVYAKMDNLEYVDCGEIGISKDEKSFISGIKGKTEKKIAFTITCLNKYNQKKYNRDRIYINCKELKQAANSAHTTKDKLCTALNNLQNIGYIDITHGRQNIAIKVNTILDQSSQSTVYDINNLGHEYLRIFKSCK